MKAYESARKTATAEGILLNANEAPFTHVDDPMWQRMSLNRYPPPQPAALRSRLAEMYAVHESKVLVTRGSDEGIDLLTRVFCRPGQDAIVECSPCFGMYRIAATIQGARVIDVPRQADKGLKIDFARLAEVIDQQADIKLVFLTSPNNPTGDVIGRGQLEAVLKVCRDKALVVLDEAYIEFCDVESACGLVDKWPQLVVLRTLSKAWAAAGVRCGTVIADPAVISLLQRVIAPYPLAATAIDAALQAISGQAIARQQQFVESVGRSRSELMRFLLSCDWIRDVYESEANFVLMRVADADGLVAFCEGRNIKIRNFNSQAQLEGCVRLSIGSETEMAELKLALQSFGEQA